MTSGLHRGSVWRKWDLHVHTPCSLKQNYGGDQDEVWERFVSELEALPDEVDVLGVNDYFFIDGYKRLVDYRSAGRLENIRTLLPVVELRLPMFGGSGSKLSRINYHVIFSEEVAQKTITDQFLPAIKSEFTLEPPGRGAARPDFDGIVTRESLEELGAKIIESAPDSRRSEFSSPQHEGFSNLTVEITEILTALDKSYFRGKYLTAIGKTEWADVKWTDPVIAAKRSIVNQTDMVFTASESPEAYRRGQSSLAEASVNQRLLDCSDSHSWSDAADKDRIGNCDQWIKADPTFEGLRHAVHSDQAYYERTFVGVEPPKLKHVRENQTRYVDSLRVSKRSGSQLTEAWFDVKLDFNPGLVAVIGNRGNGKSALTDILALLGASRSNHFSFLNADQFRRPPAKKASEFEAKLSWASGDVEERNLGEDVADEALERVRYIPQGYFEEVCNEIIEGEISKFEQEINSVVFAHIPEARRLTAESLEELIELRTEQRLRRIDESRADLTRLNRQIVEAECRLTERHESELYAKVNAKWDELYAHLTTRPSEVEAPSEKSSLQEKIEKLRERKQELDEDRDELASELAGREQARNELASLKERIEGYVAGYHAIREEWRTRLTEYEFRFEDVLSVTTDLDVIECRIEQHSERIGEISRDLSEDTEDSLQAEIDGVAATIEKLTGGLEEAAKQYEQFQTDLEEWRNIKNEILGNPDQLDTLRNLRRRVARLAELPDRLDSLYKQRKTLTRAIYKHLSQVGEVFRDLHEPVHSFIESSEVIHDEYEVNFEVVMRQHGFLDSFLNKVDQSVRGTFRGRKEGRSRLREMQSHTDYEDEGSVLKFCESVIDALHHDRRSETGEKREVGKQLLKGVERHEVYDYVFGLGYLTPGYELRLGGTSVEHLSPGERGIALLIFFLLVSRDMRPLIIDQPEGNLDSQSVYESLAPCIRQARTHRQVFLVTHSPNLAVVCDAEQIVHASIDKEDRCQVTYRSGSIENPSMNEVSINVLEGTPPAFLDRQSKYHSLREG